ncbi:hypothetical protein CHS0354_033596 [Potamilus streckersoni]|uniref:Uncharacterized protein n=1 Tax=Potamilus streckersoni TaxID=2493646 RepID=A0AAE0T0G6_9BIVA|nr:hypothetical protein CHS0354_033596 [Potamilus streckersoni]
MALQQIRAFGRYTYTVIQRSLFPGQKQPSRSFLMFQQSGIAKYEPTKVIQGQVHQNTSHVLQMNNATKQPNIQCVRTNVRVHYRPSAAKRIGKHGLEKRLSSPTQKEILFRRLLKGRATICVFDRFLNNVRFPKKKGFNLFDPKVGYLNTTKIKKYTL